MTVPGYRFANLNAARLRPPKSGAAIPRAELSIFGKAIFTAIYRYGTISKNCARRVKGKKSGQKVYNLANVNAGRVNGAGFVFIPATIAGVFRDFAYENAIQKVR